MGGEESKLAGKDHWEQTYFMEHANFVDHGDIGQVWYGSDVQRKVVDYIMERYVEENLDRPSLSFLDVGTGNGALLFKLAKRGIYNEVANVTLKGMDYSPESVTFSVQVRDTYSAKEDISEGLRSDFAKILFEVQDAFELMEQGQYDIVNDKGAFDVVFLNHELNNNEYVRAMHHRMNQDNPNAIFIITSCNCTSAELEIIFGAEGLFEKVCEIGGINKF